MTRAPRLPDHRSDDQAPAAAGTCPVCRGADTPLYGVGRDRLFGLAPGEYRLHRCRGCRCVFQHPLPHDEALAGFYPEEYWWGGATGASGALSRLLARAELFYREAVVRDHVRFVARCAGALPGGGRRLLDIGCGSGTFLAMARRRGFEPFGMDVSERAVAAARGQYGLDVRQGAIGSPLWERSSFDLVTMFHVLEHVCDPRRALDYARGLLNPSGRLIVQVPNAGSIQAGVFGMRWYGLDVPRHVINFSAEGLEILLREAGMEIRAVSRFSLRDNPAALASSIAPSLDPIGRKGRRRDLGRPVTRAVLELAYFSLTLLALPLALAESACGLGATLWVAASPLRVGGKP